MQGVVSGGILVVLHKYVLEMLLHMLLVVGRLTD